MEESSFDNYQLSKALTFNCQPWKSSKLNRQPSRLHNHWDPLLCTYTSEKTFKKTCLRRTPILKKLFISVLQANKPNKIVHRDRVEKKKKQHVNSQIAL